MRIRQEVLGLINPDKDDNESYIHEGSTFAYFGPNSF
jgi:hypothetical protein